MIERHETLRTIFPEAKGTSYQHVLSPTKAQVKLLRSDVNATELQGTLVEAVRYSFNLAVEPAIRAQLFVLGPNEHVLLLLIHHIVGDGWSLTPLTHDLALAYTARCEDVTPQWSPLPVQYTDYALWQEKLLGSESDKSSLVAEQINYWKKALANLPDQIEILQIIHVH